MQRIQFLFYCMVLEPFPKNLNQEILKNLIFYLKATTRFDRPLREMTFTFSVRFVGSDKNY